MERLMVEKKSLQEINDEVVQAAAVLRTRVMQALGIKSIRTYYDLLKGLRKVSDAEKTAIAAILGKQVDEILWPGETAATSLVA